MAPTIQKPFYQPNLTGKIHPEAETAIRILFTAVQQQDKALGMVNGTVTAAAAAATTIIREAPTGSTTPAANVIGGVNNQVAAYAVQNSDNGKLVTMALASPDVVTLTTGLQVGFVVAIENLGPSDVTLQPDTSTGPSDINGVGTILLIPNQSAWVFYDGINWWAATSTSLALQTNGTPNGSQDELNLVAGTNITITDGGTGSVTIASTGGGGGAPTMTSNSDGVCADYGNGYVEQFGLSAAAPTGVDRTSVVVTFPVPFAGIPIVVCSADNHPDSYGISVFPSYPTNVTTTGFIANIACGVTIGGGGPANLTNVVHMNWIAKYYP